MYDTFLNVPDSQRRPKSKGASKLSQSTDPQEIPARCISGSKLDALLSDVFPTQIVDVECCQNVYTLRGAPRHLSK
ncbi:hypothetical protein E8E14_000036, partial [Neopestalotiopsis sp. 37M]